MRLRSPRKGPAFCGWLPSELTTSIAIAAMPGIVSSSSSSSSAEKHVLQPRLVPRRMFVVAEDQFRADARNLACRLRSLHVAQVAEELHGSRQAIR